MGRPKGSPNKRTLEVTARLAALGCDPIEGMAKIAADEMALGINGDRTLAGRMYAELAQYVAPKRKAVEHSGSIDAVRPEVVAEVLAALKGG